MFVGEMNSKELYLNAHPKMKQAFDFLERCFQKPIAPGRYEIDGEDVYAIVFQYVPQEKETPRYETHNAYIDIQCMAAGSEFQWYLPRADLPLMCHINQRRILRFTPLLVTAVDCT